MRNLLLIGGEALAAYADVLEAEGFSVTKHAPGADLTPEGEHAVVIIDVGAAAEDRLARSFLQAAQSGDAPPVIALVTPAQLPGLDPERELDDFVLAGASAEELLARIRQVVWKRHRVDTRNVLKCGDLVMDLANYTVHVAGHPVELTFKEYELLRYLATNQGRVVNRETLLSKVWGYDFYGGARTVDVHIRRLRSKIEDRHNSFIDTVRNVGYRFRAMP
ncbi:MAG TPA: response regulator transcription factor [Dehalococcoidia bacterium]|nr:response regulator transcription factor [Dehalococcoidia bacterium]